MVSILGNISRLKVECVLRGLLIGRGQEVKGVNEKVSAISSFWEALGQENHGGP